MVTVWAGHHSMTSFSMVSVNVTRSIIGTVVKAVTDKGVVINTIGGTLERTNSGVYDPL